MLDKLVTMRVDFSADGSTISIVLRAEPEHVEPPCPSGPTLPPETGNRLFESLVAIARRERQAPALRPRLYIVRLIPNSTAEPPGPRTFPDNSGADFTVRLNR
jgi:hypothetical protein